jgi:hypothetical protein
LSEAIAMSHTWNKIAFLSAVGVACSLAVWLGSTSAKVESSVLVKKPAAEAANAQQGPILPPPSNPNENAAPSLPVDDLPAPSTKAVPAKAAQPLSTPPQAAQPATPGVKRPFLRPAVPRGQTKGQLVVGEEAMPVPPGAAIVGAAPAAPTISTPIEGVTIYPTPRIDYDTDGDARKMYRTGKIDMIMLTTDPTSNRTYEIPMTIPACCVGDPKVSSRRGIFGRGIVEYRWDSGFRAIVKFRHVLGDVEVEYEGD